MIVVLVGIFYWSINKEFIVQNFILSIITYSWILIYIIFPIQVDAIKRQYNNLFKPCLIVLLAQCAIGFVQSLYGFYYSRSFDLSNGDYVEGTIHLPLSPGGGFTNAFFALNIIGLFLFVGPNVIKNKKKLILPLFGCLIVLIMSSVVHALLMFSVSVILSYLIFKPKFEFGVSYWQKMTFAALLILVPILASIFLAKNLSNLNMLADKFRKVDTPKSIVYKDLFTTLPFTHEYMPYLGLGPGQFSSRASLIGTELYLGGFRTPIDLPLVEPAKTHALNTYIIPHWIWLEKLPFSPGSSLQPFSSWISVIGEFGLVVFLLLVMLLAIKLLQVKRKLSHDRITGFSIGAFWIFVFLIGFQENYWELPQAFIASALGMKILEASHVNNET